MDGRVKRRLFGVAVVAVLGIAAAGVGILRSELSGFRSPFRSAEQATDRKPYASEVAKAYLDAFARGDVEAAAALTDNPLAAAETLRAVRAGLRPDSVDTVFGGVEVAPAVVDGRFRVRWTFSAGRSWSYGSTLTLLENDEGWLVRWSPTLVHPALREGQSLVLRTRAGRPAVVDAGGDPLLVWRGTKAVPAEDSAAPILTSGLATVAQDRSPDEWAVVVTDRERRKLRVVHGRDPAARRPLRATLRLDVQRAAQRAVDPASGPAALVALRPSTGDILAVAQNAAAGERPMALSGLRPPGSTFKLATAAATVDSGTAGVATRLECPGEATIGTRTLRNDGGFDLGRVALRTAFARSCNTTFGRLAAKLTSAELVAGADALGLGADFAIPGIATEAGTVVPAGSQVQRVEDGIGQGDVLATPFGAALMVATVAEGAALTPRLWQDDELGTSVLTGYRAPSPAVTRALRGLLRAVVTGGTARSLAPLGTVYGKTGTAESDGGGPHGWFAGYRGDVAFAVLVERAGSASPALAVAGDFLRDLPR